MEYEQYDSMEESSQDTSYPVTLPSVYQSTEYPTLIPVYPGRPVKLIRGPRTISNSSRHKDINLKQSVDDDSAGLESSDTESSEAVMKGSTGIGAEVESDADNISSKGEVDTPTLTSEVSQQDLAINEYIEKAKRKAKELKEKSIIIIIIWLVMMLYISWLLET